MWYVYVLRSNKAKQWYTGSTKDLRKRIISHNKSMNKSTKYGVPWELIYFEASLDHDDARARERYLKSGPGKKYLRNRLKFFFAISF